MDLEIEKIVVGDIDTNCYIVTCGKELLVIDPGDEAEKIGEIIDSKKQTKKKYILLTHAHYDHVLAVGELKKKYGFEIIVGIKERDIYENLPAQGMFTGRLIKPLPEADKFVLDGEKITFGECEIEVLFTPGHTEGSACYLMGENLFSGDTLFYHVYGRTDLPTGSLEVMNESLKKLFSLKQNLRVLPGHHRETKLYSEKEFFSLHQREMGLNLGK